MIRVQRGPEPAALVTVRSAELQRVRALVRSRHQPSSDELGTRYQVVAEALWRAQFFKCCYCESREQQRRNDVEHFRPKARAVRAPGSAASHGYWWLAWNWDNLLFSCRNCNQAPYKLDKFPLARGSVALVAETQPPGRERPLLLDPAQESGMDHIQFQPQPVPGMRVNWVPTPRGGSARGQETIRVCGLDRPDLIDLYNQHVEQIVRPPAELVLSEMRTGTGAGIKKAWLSCRRLLQPSMPYVGLSSDSLDHFVPDARRRRHGLVLGSL